MKRVALLEIVDVTNRTVLCSFARSASTVRDRLCGLLGAEEPAPEGGLLLQPSSGVHTCGMRFMIDVVALDRRLRVVGAWESVKPWRVRGLSFRTRSILELRHGRIRACGVSIGDQLVIRPVTQPQAL